MMQERASLFVIVFTVINVVACVWLLWWTARMRGNAPAQSSDGTDANQVTGHVWDGDLEEYNNPLPRWWLWLFILTVVFGAAYLYLYPGLGNFAGAKSWTSQGVYEAHVREQQERLEQRFAGMHQLSLHDLAKDPTAMSTARNLFSANCAACHGSDARGAKGFPNLTDTDWLWGGTESAVYDSIAQGRQAAMPALGSVLGRDGVNEVASYVLSLSGVKAPPEWVSAGEQRFATLCVGCHGADAKGNALLGAPNLTDKTWLFGGDFESVRTTIEGGRNGQMPAHASMLGETKVKLLAAYVLSLSGPVQQADNEVPGGMPVGASGDAAP